jgi:hypothetical protein
MEKAYYVNCSELKLKLKLKPTGRYKLRTYPVTNTKTLYIEHKGLIFKKWISEEDIIFIEDEIFTCGERQ